MQPVTELPDKKQQIRSLRTTALDASTMQQAVVDSV